MLPVVTPQATVVDRERWSVGQHGRELTVYIFRHVDAYTEGDWAGKELPSTNFDAESGQELQDIEVFLQHAP